MDALPACRLTSSDKIVKKRHNHGYVSRGRILSSHSNLSAISIRVYYCCSSCILSWCLWLLHIAWFLCTEK